MPKSAIAFEFTSQMWEWFKNTKLSGPVCVVDSWTYGRCLATPNENGNGYAQFSTNDITRN
jgi:hypothetical protein